MERFCAYYVPITPIMDQKMDQIVFSGLLMPQKLDLDRISKEINDERRRESWLDITLAVMVMLHNVEMQVEAE